MKCLHAPCHLSCDKFPGPAPPSQLDSLFSKGHDDHDDYGNSAIPPSLATLPNGIDDFMMIEFTLSSALLVLLI